MLRIKTPVFFLLGSLIISIMFSSSAMASSKDTAETSKKAPTAVSFSDNDSTVKRDSKPSHKIRLSEKATKITVNARASKCGNSSPVLLVKDGKDTLATFVIKGDNYKTYTINKNISKGNHDIKLSLQNCSSPIKVKELKFVYAGKNQQNKLNEDDSVDDNSNDDLNDDNSAEDDSNDDNSADDNSAEDDSNDDSLVSDR